MKKKCLECFKEKPLEEYHKDNSYPDGHKPRCINCKIPNNKQEKELDKKKLKYDYPENATQKEKHAIRGKKYQAKHREKYLAYARKYYQENKAEINAKRAKTRKEKK